MKREKTAYPGVFYRTGKRTGGKGTEKIFYAVFKKGGKLFEERLGRQFADAMTPAKAARIRADLIEGRRMTAKERRALENAQKWTFDNLWKEYLENKGPDYVHHADKSRFRRYVGPALGDKRPEDLLPQDLKGLKNLIETKSDQTKNSVLALVTRLAAFGRKKMLTPGLRFTIEKPRLNNGKTEHLTDAELKNLLAVIQEDGGQVAKAMHLAITTGMRKAEILKLEWRDIDFENGFILLRDPKGGKNETIPMSTAARQVIEALPRTGAFVFQELHEKAVTTIDREARGIKERAGLAKDFRAFHGLRHSFASMLASSGKVELYVIQRLLTHKSPVQTQRYAHLRDAALKRGAEVAADIIQNGK